MNSKKECHDALPLSCSHSGDSGDEAPLHSLRGPKTGETLSKPSNEPGLSSGTSLWHEENEGSVEQEGKGHEDERRGYRDEQEGIYGQGTSKGAELALRLQVDCVSVSSSEAEPLQFSSSKVSDITTTHTHKPASEHEQAFRLCWKIAYTNFPTAIWAHLLDMPSDSILKLLMSSPAPTSFSAPTPQQRGPMAVRRLRAWISSEMVSRLRRAVLYSSLAWDSLAWHSSTFLFSCCGKVYRNNTCAN